MFFPDQNNREEALFGKAYFVKSCSIDVQPSSFPSHEYWASLRMIFRVLHGANVPACYFEACCLLLSFVFLTAWKIRLVNQVGARQACLDHLF